MGYGYDSECYGLRLDRGQLVSQQFSRQRKGIGSVVCTSLFSLQFFFFLSRSSFVVLVGLQLVCAAGSYYSVKLKNESALRWYRQRGATKTIASQERTQDEAAATAWREGAAAVLRTVRSACWLLEVVADVLGLSCEQLASVLSDQVEQRKQGFDPPTAQDRRTRFQESLASDRSRLQSSQSIVRRQEALSEVDFSRFTDNNEQLSKQLKHISIRTSTGLVLYAVSTKSSAVLPVNHSNSNSFITNYLPLVSSPF